jgi:hypothetical protein
MGATQPSEKLSEPTPFQKFDALARRIIKVPKAVVDRRAKKAKAERQRKK